MQRRQSRSPPSSAANESRDDGAARMTSVQEGGRAASFVVGTGGERSVEQPLDTVGIRRGLLVVRDDDDRAACLLHDVPQVRKHPLPGVGIEIAGGLIG